MNIGGEAAPIIAIKSFVASMEDASMQKDSWAISSMVILHDIDSYRLLLK